LRTQCRCILLSLEGRGYISTHVLYCYGVGALFQLHANIYLICNTYPHYSSASHRMTMYPHFVSEKGREKRKLLTNKINQKNSCTCVIRLMH